MNWGQQNTEADAHEQLDYAMTQGINFIDTAEMYPRAADQGEARTDRKLYRQLACEAQNRNDLIIASKVSAPSTLVRTRNNAARLDKAGIRSAIDGTLERLPASTM